MAENINILNPRSVQVLNLRPILGQISHRWFMSKLRISNLQKLAYANSKNPEFDWEKLGYCCGALLREFEPRKYRFVGKTERWMSWPDCSPETILARGKYRLECSIGNVPDHIVSAVEKGIARSRGFKGVMGGELIAKVMGVTYEVRTLLDLRAIGAIDVPKADRAAIAAKRRKKRNAELKVKARQRSGATPRSESVASQARAMGISPSALRQRQCRERRKRSQIIEMSNNVVDVTFSAPHKNTKYSKLCADENVTFVVPFVSNGHPKRDFSVSGKASDYTEAFRNSS